MTTDYARGFRAGIEAAAGSLDNLYPDTQDTVADMICGILDDAKREIRALAPAAPEPSEDDADEAYELGKRDGYQDAVRDIDLATGGDGEFRYCTDGDPDRHCPTVDTMKARIIDRFNAQHTEPSEAEIDRVAAFMMGQCDPVWSQDEWPIANEEIKDKWRDRARAALAAMRPTLEPTEEMVTAALNSKARDDEGDFPSLSDLLDFSGENKARSVAREAIRAALAAGRV